MKRAVEFVKRFIHQFDSMEKLRKASRSKLSIATFFVVLIGWGLHFLVFHRHGNHGNHLFVFLIPLGVLFFSHRIHQYKWLSVLGVCLYLLIGVFTNAKAYTQEHSENLSVVVASDWRVSGSDTLRRSGMRYRLAGIDSVLRTDKCNKRKINRLAIDFLRSAVEDKVVTCKGNSVGRSRYVTAHCSVDGVDLGYLLVISGYAVPYLRYSDEYVETEAIAQKHYVGIWSKECLDEEEKAKKSIIDKFLE